MVKREIKNFDFVLGENKYPCVLPCSASSVLSESNVDISEMKGYVSFDAEIMMDDAALSMKNIYLRISGINMPAAVYISDKKVADITGKLPVYNIDAKPFLEKGKNILSIRFDADDQKNIDRIGLFSTIEMLRFSGAIIDSVRIDQTHSEGEVLVGIRLTMLGNSDAVRAVATLVSPAGQIYYAGLTKGQGSIRVADPLYWWPKGLGVQNLYRLTVNLYGELDIEDTAEVRIGLRNVEGEDSQIKIGDTKVVPMGAVYLPAKSVDPSVAAIRADSLVTSASMSGFNTLVVEKDSPIPCEKFYELCDIHGIMVIEEHSEVNAENIEAIRLRSHHASLVAVDILDAEDTDKIKASIEKEVPSVAIFHREKNAKYVSAPALPSMKSLRAVIPESERSLFSYSVESISEENAICDMLLSVAEKYPYPADLSAFAYASALAAANKVGCAVKESRMSCGKSGRAIFNRLGDTELTVSSSSIDFRSRWKPLQYYSKNHFSPVKIYADYEDGYVIFSASCHRRVPFSGVLEYRVADSKNATVHKGSEKIELAPMTASRIATADLTQYVLTHEREYYIEFCLKEGASILSRGVLLFVPEKHFEFIKPKLKTDIIGEGKSFYLTVSSDVFVKDLEIDFDGIDIILSDNYIDLTTDSPVRIDITVTGGRETVSRLKDALILRSMADLK